MNAELTIKPRPALMILGSATSLLSLISLAGNLYTAAAENGRIESTSIASKIIINNITPLFSAYREENFATYFNSILFFIAAALLLFAWFASKAAPAMRHRNGWPMLASIFLFLSADEIAMIHEKYDWGPILILTGILCLLLIPFLLEIPKGVRNTMLISGGLYIVGASGLDSYANIFIEQSGSIQAAELRIPYIICYTLEEFLEMIGITIFIYAILRFLAGRRFQLLVRQPKI